MMPIRLSESRVTEEDLKPFPSLMEKLQEIREFLGADVPPEHVHDVLSALLLVVQDIATRLMVLEEKSDDKAGQGGLSASQ